MTSSNLIGYPVIGLINLSFMIFPVELYLLFLDCSLAVLSQVLVKVNYITCCVQGFLFTFKSLLPLVLSLKRISFD